MPDGLPPLFIQLPPFAAGWDRLELGDEHLTRLEGELIANPEAGPVVPGGEGMRKLRFALPGKGKRGGCRVYYRTLPGGAVVVLAIVFGKNEAADLGPSLRAELVQAVTEVAGRFAAPEDNA